MSEINNQEFPELPHPPANCVLRPATAGINADVDVFICLYGSFSGDIWHVAAADILSRYQLNRRSCSNPNPFQRVRFRTAISINKYDRNRADAGKREQDWKRLAVAPQQKVKGRGTTTTGPDDDEFRKVSGKEPPKSIPNLVVPRRRGTAMSALLTEQRKCLAEEKKRYGKRLPTKNTPKRSPSSKRSKEKAQTIHPIRPLINGANHASKKEAAVISRGRTSWTYLHSIGLKSALVIVPDRKGQGQFQIINDSLTWVECMTTFQRQNNYYTETDFTDFDTLAWLEVLQLHSKVYKIARESNGKRRTLPVLENQGPGKQGYLVDLAASTSIVMQQMKYLGPLNTYHILGHRLSGGTEGPEGDIPNDTRNKAGIKVQKLTEIIRKIQQAVNKAKKTGNVRDLKGVVIFNYRLGDVNVQHDSNPQILDQFKSLAGSKGFATIIIPQCNKEQWKEAEKAIKTDSKDPYSEKYVFDFLDTLNEDSENPKRLPNAVKVCLDST